jgi:DNA repair exonuclease SbcCD ATPase subunit
MDERPERPERDDFSDWTRAELEEYCLELEELTDDQDRFLNRVWLKLEEMEDDHDRLWKRVSAVVSLYVSALETPVEDIPERNLKAALNISRRRNKKLKERVETLETEREDAKKKALAKGVDARLRELEREREIVRLQQKCERLAERVRETAPEHENQEVDRLARAVADGHRNGEHWASGAELKRWLADAENLTISTRTIQNRLEAANLWVRAGQKGLPAVDETVKRCVEYASR